MILESCWFKQIEAGVLFSDGQAWSTHTEMCRKRKGSSLSALWLKALVWLPYDVMVRAALQLSISKTFTSISSDLCFKKRLLAKQTHLLNCIQCIPCTESRADIFSCLMCPHSPWPASDLNLSSLTLTTHISHVCFSTIRQPWLQKAPSCKFGDKWNVDLVPWIVSPFCLWNIKAAIINICINNGSHDYLFVKWATLRG